MITISSGQLSRLDTSENVDYTVNAIDDIAELFLITDRADTAWAEYRSTIIQQHIIPLAQTTPENVQAALQKFNLEDHHWNWTNKALAYRSDNYFWFYLEALGEIQGIALIYHPKKSFILNHNIFYVEYLAVAPWNRSIPTYNRVFSNIGKILIKSCAPYCIKMLKFIPGFSLHSLPKSEGFYRKIGMQDLGIDTGYHNLRRFEMDQSKYIEFLKHGEAA